MNDQAGLNPVDTGTDIGVQWFVMGSTASLLVDAVDNANLVPDVPIYLMDGTTRVAESVNQLFGCCEAGSAIVLTSPLNQDQFGNSVGDIRVWTGTGQDGLTNDAKAGSIPGAALGEEGLIAFGLSGQSNQAWIYNSTAFIRDGGTGGNPVEHPFYAFSELLPEPSSGLLLGLGGTWLLSLGRRRTRSS